MKPTLRKKFESEITDILVKEFNIKNALSVPKIEKVVVNSGVGDVVKNKELLEFYKKEMAAITGQTPSVRRARISVASFNLREGMPVGLKVTLRGDRMYNFVDKLFSITLPRLRDFRGLSLKSFDKDANYTLGIEEHTVFPEVDFTKLIKPFGLEITIVTSTKKILLAKRLLELMGMPFQKIEAK